MKTKEHIDAAVNWTALAAKSFGQGSTVAPSQYALMSIANSLCVIAHILNEEVKVGGALNTQDLRRALSEAARPRPGGHLT